jgi:hypothetical protein
LEKKQGQRNWRAPEKEFPNCGNNLWDIDKNKNVENPEINFAIEKADVMVHGSGPLLLAADHLAFWMKNTDKPFGVFGTIL